MALSQKVEQMKAAAEAAMAAFKQADEAMKAAGKNSKERYAALNDQKQAALALCSAYAAAAKKEISKKLDKIIAKQTPAQRAEGLRRARSCV